MLDKKEIDNKNKSYRDQRMHLYFKRQVPYISQCQHHNKSKRN